MATLDPGIKDLALGPNFAALSFHLSGDQIATHVMWIDATDEHLLINTEVHRAKYRAMTANPAVTVMVWDATNPYRYGEVALYPPDQPVVTVHHRDGQDAVEIEGCGDNLAGFAAAVGERHGEAAGSPQREATGMSRNLSFDEAFANALAQLPPPASQHPDQLTSVVVVETGGLFGGFAGFHHLYVRIRGSSD